MPERRPDVEIKINKGKQNISKINLYFHKNTCVARSIYVTIAIKWIGVLDFLRLKASFKQTFTSPRLVINQCKFWRCKIVVSNSTSRLKSVLSPLNRSQHAVPTNPYKHWGCCCQAGIFRVMFTSTYWTSEQCWRR